MISSISFINGSEKRSRYQQTWLDEKIPFHQYEESDLKTPASAIFILSM